MLMFVFIQTSGILFAQESFNTADEAATKLIAAAEKFDTAELEKIFGPDSKDLIISAEPPRDEEIAKTFAELGREKKSISVDPKNKNLAYVVVGKDNWRFAIPLVKKNGKWMFDTAAGREELINRRVGGNELDAIDICHGFVEAQEEYALQKHDGSEVNQYAQRIISSPGKQDGLAWQNPKCPFTPLLTVPTAMRRCSTRLEQLRLIRARAAKKYTFTEVHLHGSGVR